jgi:hypothetical protein
VISFEVIKKIPFMESFIKEEKGKGVDHEAEAGKN